ncbi:MAG TPA: DUF1345 domain-containing protein [Steroidobacteraceae bacterium]|jgi:uncharacterized membrane protein|nr:DUF1345 domain-containing protein [Steroidobacteraceae bacterium]
MRKFFFEHPRLWISVIAGTALFFFLPGQWSILSRVLVCWDGGVILFLVLIFIWMTRLTAAQICSKYIEEDASAPIILVVVTLAAMLSLVAIVEPLATVKQVTGSVRAAHFALAALTLIDSWILVPTMFTTHYADLYYSAKDDERPLHFPQSPMPVFWDFIYFSFTIAAACQTADVATLNAAVRKTVVVHTLISFLFNASILGFAINVTAGLIGGN